MKSWATVEVVTRRDSVNNKTLSLWRKFVRQRRGYVV